MYIVDQRSVTQFDVFFDQPQAFLIDFAGPRQLGRLLAHELEMPEQILGRTDARAQLLLGLQDGPSKRVDYSSGSFVTQFASQCSATPAGQCCAAFAHSTAGPTPPAGSTAPAA